MKINVIEISGKLLEVRVISFFESDAKLLTNVFTCKLFEKICMQQIDEIERTVERTCAGDVWILGLPPFVPRNVCRTVPLQNCSLSAISACTSQYATSYKDIFSLSCKFEQHRTYLHTYLFKLLHDIYFTEQMILCTLCMPVYFKHTFISRSFMFFNFLSHSLKSEFL